jgi:hypothetical protein
MRSFTENEKRFNGCVAEFNRLIRKRGIGSIDGVEFDLSHKNLDILRWPPFSILHSALFLPGEKVNGVVENQVSIWFHWFGNYDPEALRVKLLRSRQYTMYESEDMENATKGVRKLTPPEVEDIVAASKPKYHVNRGDKINVYRVDDEIVGDEFQHPDDSIVKRVYIQITRADKSIEKISTPYIVPGCRRVLAVDADNSDAYMNIILRIVDFYHLKNPKELERVEQTQSNAYYAAGKALSLYKRLKTAWDPSLDENGALVEVEEAAWLRSVVKDAVRLGYLWAYAEVELELKPLAVLRRAHSDATSKAAKRGVETSQKKAAAKEWRRLFKPFAIDYCAKIHNALPSKRGPSRSKIATEFASSWEGDEKDLAEHQTIVKEIIRLEDAGQLQRLRPKNQT